MDNGQGIQPPKGFSPEDRNLDGLDIGSFARLKSRTKKEVHYVNRKMEKP